MKKILEQIEIVFDNNEEVKACGRNNCIKLMEMLEEKFPDFDFGNKSTGFMNLETVIPVIRMLRGKLTAETQKQYNIVFDNNKQQKVCGRENCIKLMEMLEKEFPGHTFGNKSTGFMDLEKINLINI